MVLAPILTAFWTILPAIAPNTAAFLGGGRYPIDRGGTWRGARLLGDGTTIDGTLIGIIAGVLTAALLNALQPATALVSGMMLPIFPITVMIAMPIGAMLGDITASFAKRRVGYGRGTAVPVLDQIDALVGAVVAAVLVAPAWASTTFTLPVIGVIVFIVPVTRLLGNIIYHRIGLKDVPW